MFTFCNYAKWSLLAITEHLRQMSGFRGVVGGFAYAVKFFLMGVFASFLKARDVYMRNEARKWRWGWFRWRLPSNRGVSWSMVKFQWCQKYGFCGYLSSHDSKIMSAEHPWFMRCKITWAYLIKIQIEKNSNFDFMETWNFLHKESCIRNKISANFFVNFIPKSVNYGKNLVKNEEIQIVSVSKNFKKSQNIESWTLFLSKVQL